MVQGRVSRARQRRLEDPIQSSVLRFPCQCLKLSLVANWQPMLLFQHKHNMVLIFCPSEQPRCCIWQQLQLLSQLQGQPCMECIAECGKQLCVLRRRLTKWGTITEKAQHISPHNEPHPLAAPWKGPPLLISKFGSVDLKRDTYSGIWVLSRLQLLKPKFTP